MNLKNPYFLCMLTINESLFNHNLQKHSIYVSVCQIRSNRMTGFWFYFIGGKHFAISAMP